MIVLNEVLYAEEWLEKDVPWKKAGHVLHYGLVSLKLCECQSRNCANVPHR